MKNFFLIVFVLGLSAALAGAQTVTVTADEVTNDVSPVRNLDANSRATGDFLYYLDMGTLTGDIRLLGVECDDTYWYLTGARDYNGCYFYQTDFGATTVLNMVATGHSGWGWRDLGYDGTYLYASDSYNLEQIDPATGTPTGVTIPGPVSPVRAVGYDSATDTFWTASFSSSLYQFDRSGTILQTIPNPGLSMYGAAMDESNNILWWWSQDGSGTLASAMDPATGTFTGDSWDGGSNPMAGIAGGACIFNDPTSGDQQFGGMHQSSPDNVAVYDMPAANPFPHVDIRCNGENGGVQIYEGDNVKLDFDVFAGVGAGFPVDIWVALKTPFGFFSYDGLGPYMGWNYGLGSAFYTGPLADMQGVALDHSLPQGAYKAFVGIDTVANGTLNMANIYTMDMVDFDVIPAPRVYMYDDGSTENLLAWSAGGDMCWLHRFNAYAGGETITEIHAIWGSAMYPGYNPGNGTPATVYVWDDPTEDGDPNDAVLVATEPTTVQNVDTDIYNIIPLTTPPTIVDEFYFGAMQTHSIGQYVAPIDQTTPYVWGNGFFCGTNTAGGFDPANLGGNQYPPAEWGNYWCVRAGY